MEKINQRACYNSIWSWSPMPCEKHDHDQILQQNEIGWYHMCPEESSRCTGFEDYDMTTGMPKLCKCHGHLSSQNVTITPPHSLSQPLYASPCLDYLKICYVCDNNFHVEVIISHINMRIIWLDLFLDAAVIAPFDSAITLNDMDCKKNTKKTYQPYRH